VSWEGYDSSDDTWEPYDSLIDTARELVTEYDKNNPASVENKIAPDIVEPQIEEKEEKKDAEEKVGDEFEVEAVIDYNAAKKEYLVKWKGYAETTWEHVSNLENSMGLIQEYHKLKKKNKSNKKRTKNKNGRKQNNHNGNNNKISKKGHSVKDKYRGFTLSKAVVKQILKLGGKLSERKDRRYVYSSNE